MTSLWQFISDRRELLQGNAAVTDAEGHWSFEQLRSAVFHIAEELGAAEGAGAEPLVLPIDQRRKDVAILLAASHVGRPVVPVNRRELETNSALRSRLAHALGSGALLAEDSDGLRLVPLSTTDRAPIRLPDAAFLLLLTSGSSGPRKLSLHSETGVIATLETYKQVWNLSASDRVIVPLPLEHSFGLIGGLLAGLAATAGVTVIPSSPPRNVLRQIADRSASILFGAPPMFEILAESTLSDGPGVHRLRLCMSSGIAMTPEARKACASLFEVEPIEIYGSTEAGIIAAAWRDAERRTLHLVPGVEACIPDSDSGLLEFRMPWLHLGYLDLDRGNFLPQQGLWWRSADLGRIAAGGALTISGRISSFVNSGGRKINTHEVETHLRTHPEVKDAHCYGIPSIAGEQLVAVVLTHGVLTSEAVAHFCRQYIGHAMTPNAIFITGHPFRAPNGKVVRDLLPRAPSSL